MEQTLKKQLVVPFCSPRFSFEVDPKFFFIFAYKTSSYVLQIHLVFQKNKKQVNVFQVLCSPTLGIFQVIPFNRLNKIFISKPDLLDEKKNKFLTKLAELK